MNIMKEEWDRFEEMVIHPEAHIVQREEMRRSFYSGASIILKTISDMTKSDIPDGQMVDTINSMIDECSKYTKERMQMDLGPK